MNVEIALNRQLHVNHDPVWLFGKIRDIPATIHHFPRLKSFTPQGKDTWRWELHPISAAGKEYPIAFATRFSLDEKTQTVTLAPVPGTGNGLIGGHFRVGKSNGGCELLLDLKGTVEVDIPLLLRAPAKPFIKTLFSKLVDRFIERLQTDYLV